MKRKVWGGLAGLLALGAAHLLAPAAGVETLGVPASVAALLVGSRAGPLLRGLVALLRWWLDAALVQPSTVVALTGFALANAAVMQGFAASEAGELSWGEFGARIGLGYLAGACLMSVLVPGPDGFESLRRIHAALGDAEEDASRPRPLESPRPVAGGGRRERAARPPERDRSRARDRDDDGRETGGRGWLRDLVARAEDAALKASGVEEMQRRQEQRMREMADRGEGRGEGRRRRPPPTPFGAPRRDDGRES